MKSILIMILLIVIAGGCISPSVEMGDPSRYEFPGLENTTIFFLNISSVKVIDNINDTNSINYLITDNIQSFRYPAAVDYSGKNVSVNVSVMTIMGKNYANFNFSSNFSGFIAYSLPGTQDFTYLPAANTTVRIVLPNNFTARTMFMGYVQPEPDNVTQDSYQREVITWNNTQREKIRVKYHHKDTPRLLLYLLGSLFISAFIIWSYYQFSIKMLVNKRKMLEKDIRRK